MARPTHDQVRIEMKRLGALQVDEFAMAEPERKRTEAADGYCEGIALDWIRRVLQGGRPFFNATRARGNPDLVYKQKAQSQAARQAMAFMEWVPTLHKWNLTYDAARTRLEQDYSKAKAAKFTNLEAMEKKLFTLLTNTASPSVVELTPELMGLIPEFYRNPVSRMMNRNKLEELYERIPLIKRAIIDKPFDPGGEKAGELHDAIRKHAYKDFSKTMDAGSGKKRSFGNIALLFFGTTLNNLNIAGVEANLTLIGAGDLQDQRAVKINLGGPQAGREFYHSTASYINRAFRNPYVFLDPNYGIFAFPQWPDVVKAILYLYKDVYSWRQSPPAYQPFPRFTMQVDVFGLRPPTSKLKLKVARNFPTTLPACQ